VILLGEWVGNSKMVTDTFFKQAELSWDTETTRLKSETKKNQYIEKEITSTSCLPELSSALQMQTRNINKHSNDV
jgi:hypothetical protein